ncbi:MAG: penicillin-binding protein activator [Gammaproteobacteria bacterium]
MTVGRPALSALLLATLLIGCSSGIRQDETAPESRIHQQARLLADQGKFRQAAELYLQAATQATGTERQDLQLHAADSLIQAGDLQQATRLLEELAGAGLEGTRLQHYNVTRAAIAVAELRPDQALEYLATPPSSGPFVADYRRLRAEAFVQDGRFLAGARERVLLDSLITDPEKQLANEFAIWDALNSLSDTDLQQLRTAPAPDPLSGWMELVELTRLYMQQPEALEQVIPHWQRRYPEHPANRAFIAQLLDSMRGAGQPPERIALLLPLNGELAGAASAVRDGIMAAYYDSPAASTQPNIRLYDSGATAATALAAYQQAVADGAQFVIGPLHKDAVQALAELPELPVPVLALNRTEARATVPGQFYQFGLAPEDEAREAARLAWREGYTRTIALIPDTPWGTRVYTAFEQEWVALGGSILDKRLYDNSEADHGEVISSVLHLDSSKARHKQLTRLLGRNLKFEPRRRQDIDFVFLLADPGQARLIRPQLSFYRASTLPVFTTSRVYSGQPDTEGNIDLNGIVFCDMPWILAQDSAWRHIQQAISEYWPESMRHYPRLYALGIDAYRLAPYLGQQGGRLFGAYHGVSGNLSIDNQGRIIRSLRCAKFRNGTPVPLVAPTGNPPHPGSEVP